MTGLFTRWSRVCLCFCILEIGTCSFHVFVWIIADWCSWLGWMAGSRRCYQRFQFRSSFWLWRLLWKRSCASGGGQRLTLCSEHTSSSRSCRCYQSPRFISVQLLFLSLLISLPSCCPNIEQVIVFSALSLIQRLTKISHLSITIFRKTILHSNVDTG